MKDDAQYKSIIADLTEQASQCKMYWKLGKLLVKIICVSKYPRALASFGNGPLLFCL